MGKYLGLRNKGHSRKKRKHKRGGENGTRRRRRSSRIQKGGAGGKLMDVDAGNAIVTLDDYFVKATLKPPSPANRVNSLSMVGDLGLKARLILQINDCIDDTIEHIKALAGGAPGSVGGMMAAGKDSASNRSFGQPETLPLGAEDVVGTHGNPGDKYHIYRKNGMVHLYYNRVDNGQIMKFAPLNIEEYLKFD